MNKEPTINIDIEWNDLSLPLSVPVSLTIHELKQRIEEITGIPPSKQCFSNLTLPDHFLVARLKSKVLKLTEGEVKEEEKKEEKKEPLTLYQFYKMLDSKVPNHSSLTNELTSKYGVTFPTLFSGTFSNALEYSAIKKLPILLYLYNEDHQNTALFCLDVLSSSGVVNVINEAFIFFIVKTDDRMQAVLSSLFQINENPAFIILTHSVKGTSVVKIIKGLHSLDEFFTQLIEIQLTFSDTKTNQNNFVPTSEKELLLQEQEKAFRDSLAQDQEKERLRRIEESQRQKDEQIIQRSVEQQRKIREEKIKNLPSEPQPHEPEITTLAIRLLDGSRVQRRFRKKETLQVVYDYCDSTFPLDQEIKPYELTTNFPRQYFSNKSQTIEEAKLFPQSSLFLSEIEN